MWLHTAGDGHLRGHPTLPGGGPRPLFRQDGCVVALAVCGDCTCTLRCRYRSRPHAHAPTRCFDASPCAQRGFAGGRCPAQHGHAAISPSVLVSLRLLTPPRQSQTSALRTWAQLPPSPPSRCLWATLPVRNSAFRNSAFVALSFALLRRPLCVLPLNPHPPFAAASPLVRGRSVGAAVAIGSLAGFLWAYQGSAGRLMGAFENQAEVAAAQKRR